MTESGEIVIAGRTFVPAQNTSFEQDMYIMALLEDSGMESAFESLATADELTGFAKKLIIKAYKTGNLFRVLAGTLVERNVRWSPEMAEINALFFSDLTEKADKEALHDAMAGVVVGFFASAASAYEISPKSSGAPVNLTAVVERLSVDQPISETGTSLSEASPDLTLTDTE